MADSATLDRSTLRPRDFIDIIASPWPFRTSTILIFCVTALLPTVATEYSRLNRPDILVATVIGLISVSVNGVVLFAVRRWVRRTLGGAPWAIVGVLMSAGAIRGVVTSLFVAGTGLELHSYLATRVGLGAVSSPVLLAVVALVVSRVITSRDQRLTTKRAIAEAGAVRDRVLTEVSLADAKFLQDVDESLRPAIDAIVSGVSRGRLDRDALSAALDDLAENVVRPLSHSLTTNERTAAATRGSIARAVFGPGRASLSDLINPYFSALGVGLGGFSVMLDGLTGTSATIAAGIAAGTTLVLLMAARRILAERYASTIASLLVIALIHEVVWIPAQVFNDVFIFPAGGVLDYVLLGIVGTPVLGVVYGLIVLGSHSSRNHLADLDTARVTMVLQQSEARRRAWLRQRHVGHTLHSSIQSRVHAQARLLRTGGGALTPDESEGTVALLESILTVVADEPPAHNDAIRSVEDLAEFWSGMCHISLTVGDGVRDALAADVDASEAVSVVTLEMVSNAIRHGHATEITIDITRDSPETVRIRTSNNGVGLDPNHAPGLGMSIYDELSAEWSVHGGESVTVDAVIAARGNSGEV